MVSSSADEAETSLSVDEAEEDSSSGE